MTSKERVHAALEGRPVDRMPVTVLYSQLYHQDHFAELTGRPAWQCHAWWHMPPDEHVAILRQMVEQAPFEIIQPQWAPPRADREDAEFLLVDGVPHRRSRRTGSSYPLTAVSGHPYDSTANQTQRVFDEADIVRQVLVTPAEELIATGVNDYLEATVNALGDEYFVLSGGVTGTIWACHYHLGLTNLFMLMLDNPRLVERLSERILAQHIEHIRCLAAGGGDAIHVDESITTSDMLSPEQYERFGLPHTIEMVREIKSLGKKAILYYFGGVSDRLDMIADIGADGLLVECSMKGYVNDISHIARTIGDRVTLFGNIDPVWVIERGSDDVLAAEIRRQVEAGRTARGFVVCAGSPLTPGTALSRVRRFIELGREIGAYQAPADRTYDQTERA